MIQKLKYRLRYYWRKYLLALGRCPKCRTPVNYARNGRPICPACGH